MTAERTVAHDPAAGCPTCGGDLYYCDAPHQGQRSRPAWHCRNSQAHNFDVAIKDLR